jgi:transcriptional regulator with XRE-family HTH domain
MDSLENVFHKKLRALRKNYKKGKLTKANLADRLGVHINTLHRWETGGHMPGADHLRDLAEFFEVPVEYFLDETAPPVKSDRIVSAVKADQPKPQAAPINSPSDAAANLVKSLIEQNSRSGALQIPELVKAINDALLPRISTMIQGLAERTTIGNVDLETMILIKRLVTFNRDTLEGMVANVEQGGKYFDPETSAIIEQDMEFIGTVLPILDLVEKIKSLSEKEQNKLRVQLGVTDPTVFAVPADRNFNFTVLNEEKVPEKRTGRLVRLVGE